MEAGRLVEMCVEAASRSKESVRSWRKQRRTLERLPAHLAEALLHRLLVNHLLSPPLLEVFQFTVESVNLTGELSVDAEWMAYIGGFRHLRVLKAANCKSLTNSAIWHLSGLERVEELSIDRCRKITDEGLGHLVSLRKLKRLGLSETGIGPQGLLKLVGFRQLTHIDLGGLPVTDAHISALQVLQQLVHLELWGTNVSNEGAKLLASFPCLKNVNLSWTTVSIVPPMSALSCLDLCNCTVLSILDDGMGGLSVLDELHLSGAVIENHYHSLSGPSVAGLSVLGLSATNLTTFGFLSGMKRLTKLDLSSTKVSDDTMELLAQCGERLKWLDLGDTRVSSEGVEALCGHVPMLQYISLRGTLVDDKVFGYLGTMASLVDVDLSHTNLTGADVGSFPWSVLHLQKLSNLGRLDLRHTRFSDKSCKRLAYLPQLLHLLLCAEFLTDKSLHELSALPELQTLAFQGSVLTDAGLRSFKPPPKLKELDLTDCWLLTSDCLLQFSDSLRHISLKHDLIFTREKAGYKHELATVKKFDKRGTYIKHSTPHARQTDVKDERICYTVSELLDLRMAASEAPQHLVNRLNDISRLLRDF